MKPVSRAHARCWMKRNLGWSVLVASTMLVLAACGDKGGTLIVTASNIDGASGKVTLESTSTHDEGVEIDCSAGCTIPLDEGAQVTLTQSPAEGYYFGGWSGYCTGLRPAASRSDL
jgi:Divergent InlB B-repeat domain